MTGDALGPGVQVAVDKLRPGDLLMLENLRFHAEEEANGEEFARALSGFTDVYVDDAFGSAHRAHASTEGISHFLPSVAGLLMEREVDALSRLLEHPPRPFHAIVGGAKVTGKLEVLDALLSRCQAILVGGGMANTFLAAKGVAMGKSLVETDQLDSARRMMAEARRKRVRFMIPSDVVRRAADPPSCGARGGSAAPTDHVRWAKVKRTRVRRASAIIRRALSSWSVSTRLLPIATPFAARKVFAMAPRPGWPRCWTAAHRAPASLPVSFSPAHDGVERTRRVLEQPGAGIDFRAPCAPEGVGAAFSAFVGSNRKTIRRRRRPARTRTAKPERGPGELLAIPFSSSGVWKRRFSSISRSPGRSLSTATWTPGPGEVSAHRPPRSCESL